MQGPLSKMVLTQSVLGCSLPSRQKGIWQPCLDFFRLNKEHNYWLDNKHVTWQNTHAINTEGLLLKRTPKWFTYTGVNHHLDCVLCSTVLCHESISTAAVSFGPPEKACFLLKSWVWVVIFIQRMRHFCFFSYCQQIQSKDQNQQCVNLSLLSDFPAQSVAPLKAWIFILWV